MNCQPLRHALARGVWGHVPPQNFEILVLGNAIFSVFQVVFGPKKTVKIKATFTIFYVYCHF